MKKLIVPIILVFIVSSCKMGKNYSGTNLEVPQNFNEQDTLEDNIATLSVKTDTLQLDTFDIAWWELYEDPVLDSLVRVSLSNNRNVLIAAESIIQARAALGIQNAEFLPKLSFGVSAERGNFVMNQVGTESDLFLGAGSVYWELDIWGRLRRLSEAQRAALLQSEYGYRAIMISLITDVATNYFRLLQAKSQMQVAKRNVALRDSMLLIIEARFDKGIVPMIDVDQAKIQQTIAAGSVPQLKRQIVQLENALSVLTGSNPGKKATGMPLKDQNFDVELPEMLPVKLLHRRPDIIAAEYALVAQNARVGAAQANRLPSLSVSALFGVASNDLGNLSLEDPLWNIAGQLAGPIFFWNQLKLAVDIEESKRFQQLFAYENSLFNAFAEVENAYNEIRTTRQEMLIAMERKAAALQAQRISRARYDKGITSYLEFLEQQRQAFEAELLLEELRARLLIAHIKLYKALGGGWISESERD